MSLLNLRSLLLLHAIHRHYDPLSLLIHLHANWCKLHRLSERGQIPHGSSQQPTETGEDAATDLTGPEEGAAMTETTIEETEPDEKTDNKQLPVHPRQRRLLNLHASDAHRGGEAYRGEPQRQTTPHTQLKIKEPENALHYPEDHISTRQQPSTHGDYWKTTTETNPNLATPAKTKRPNHGPDMSQPQDAHIPQAQIHNPQRRPLTSACAQPRRPDPSELHLRAPHSEATMLDYMPTQWAVHELNKPHIPRLRQSSHGPGRQAHSTGTMLLALLSTGKT